MPEFKDFNLKESILKAIEKVGYKEPTPVQCETIPLIQEGLDLIALAETGSGKTAACSIPLCNRVDVSIKTIQALIIVPTRELALQYATEAQKIGKYSGVKVFAMLGGKDGDLQESKLENGVHLLIATPGRLIDFIYSRRIDLSDVRALVLDEADEMLSMGFYDDLEFIINCIIHEHQTLLFSATMPPKVRDLAVKHLKNPREITLVSKRASPKSIQHQFLYCQYKEREEQLVKLINDLKPKQSIIFCESRKQCEELQRTLKSGIHSVDFLHGGLTQDVRGIITNKFRTGRLKHLVATDVAARGLDFSGVSHVFIFQLSDDVDAYLHRSGRTGRVDRKGVVTSLITKREFQPLKKILERIEGNATWLNEPPKNLDEVHKPAGRPPRRVGDKPRGAGPRRPRQSPRTDVSS